MNIKSKAWSSFVVALLTIVAATPATRAQSTRGPIVVTNGPQTNPGDSSPTWSPQRNVTESKNYDRLLETNPAFRQQRIQKECGPITDAQLHARCVASFNRAEP